MGETKWVHQMKKKQFLTLSSLPNSKKQPLEITSPHDGFYNCIGWALGLSDKAFWPNLKKPYSWPADLPKTESIENFIDFFKKHKFEICENDKPERGFEKIAIFEKDGFATHACRQLKKNLWTSKLGALEDVRHTIFQISGGMYGEVSVFMKRKKAL